MSDSRRRRLASRYALASIVATAACDPSTLFGDRLSVAEVEGTYRLESVDGRRVEEGESRLALTPRAGGTAPLYGWNVRPPQAPDYDRDVGIWRIDDGVVHLRSRDGLGTYAATPDAATDGGPGGPLLTVRGRSGRSYTFRRVRGSSLPATLAFLEIAVVDAAGRQVPGASLHIRAPDGLVSRAGTTEFGPFLTGGPAGEWTVTFAAPTGYAVMPGQANPVRIAAAASQTTLVRIVVVPAEGQ